MGPELAEGHQRLRATASALVAVPSGALNHGAAPLKDRTLLAQASGQRQIRLRVNRRPDLAHVDAELTTDVEDVLRLQSLGEVVSVVDCLDQAVVVERGYRRSVTPA